MLGQASASNRISEQNSWRSRFAVFVTCLIGIVVMIMTPLAHIARAQKISVILAREQEPFWMTWGSIALSNLGTAPPAEAKWWWSERIAIVFVRHIAVRCSIRRIYGRTYLARPGVVQRHR
jgi:hypothetical protein